MDAFETYLLQLPRYGDKGAKAMHPGFERVNALVKAMGRPHTQFESIHIAGTNGKGSTASMVAAILRAAGHSRVGLYTSPHLTSMRERIRCDGAMVPVAWMNTAVAQYRHVMDAVQPSFFEAMTALAFLYFAEQEVSVAIVEAGLGGRLDATNILQPRLSIITCIDFDHMNVLGHSLSAIAREKGGIIKPGVPLLTATSQPEALAVLEAIGAHLRAPVHVTHRECQMEAAQGADGLELTATTPQATYSAATLELSGTHQAANAPPRYSCGGASLRDCTRSHPYRIAACEGAQRAAWPPGITRNLAASHFGCGAQRGRTAKRARLRTYPVPRTTLCSFWAGT